MEYDLFTDMGPHLEYGYIEQTESGLDRGRLEVKACLRDGTAGVTSGQRVIEREFSDRDEVVVALAEEAVELVVTLCRC